MHQTSPKLWSAARSSRKYSTYTHSRIIAFTPYPFDEDEEADEDEEVLLYITLNT